MGYNTSPQTDVNPEVHKRVLELLSAEDNKGRLLDAPAGEGYAYKGFTDMGFEVYSADLDVKRFKVPGAICNEINLNNKLPYPDSFFKYIVCIEGIEHLENPHHLIREFNRILEHGGKLILTMPNILNVYARFRYLILGSPDWLHTELDSESTELYQILRRHINPIALPELKFILEMYGFAVQIITTAGSIFSSAVKSTFFLFAGMVIKLLMLLVFKKRPLGRILTSSEILWGETLILKAEKTRNV